MGRTLSFGRAALYADFLERVARPSKLGDFSYEVVDTKLKRSPDPKHLLQLGLTPSMPSGRPARPISRARPMRAGSW